MSDIEQVSAHYNLPSGAWERPKRERNEIALAAWITAAQAAGFEVEVLEITDDHRIIAAVKVGGQEYSITHRGRGSEVEARLR